MLNNIENLKDLATIMANDLLPTINKKELSNLKTLSIKYDERNKSFYYIISGKNELGEKLSFELKDKNGKSLNEIEMVVVGLLKKWQTRKNIMDTGEYIYSDFKKESYDGVFNIYEKSINEYNEVVSNKIYTFKNEKEIFDLLKNKNENNELFKKLSNLNRINLLFLYIPLINEVVIYYVPYMAKKTKVYDNFLKNGVKLFTNISILKGKLLKNKRGTNIISCELKITDKEHGLTKDELLKMYEIVNGF